MNRYIPVRRAGFVPAITCLLAWLALAGVVRAADTAWRDGTASWFVASNWTVRVPTAADRALIDNLGTANIAENRATASSLIVGNSFTGRVNQTSGSNAVVNEIVLGYSGGSTGNYSLGPNGRFSAAELHVGLAGLGQFNMFGGAQAQLGVLTIAGDVNGSGSFNLGATGSGSLVVDQEYLFGHGYSSVFRHSNGLHTVNTLRLGSRNTGGGAYLLWGGTLQAQRESVGYEGTALLRQTGGVHQVRTELIIGEFGSGTNEITGGSLGTSNLTAESGLLILGPGSQQVYVTNRLALGLSGAFICAPSTSVRVFGSGFEIRSVHPELSSTLTNLNLIIENNPALASIECASYRELGFENNFTLGTLTLGGASFGRAALTNRFTNRSSGDPSMELFTVGRLLMSTSGSMLDLRGRELLVRDAATGLGGELRLSGGTVTVPSNSALTVNASGALVGPGRINGGVVVSGQIGLDGVVGGLSVSGFLSSSGLMDLTIGGRPSYLSQVVVAGTFSPGGTLRVRLTNGIAPILGNTFPLILYPFLNGRFATLDLPPPGGGVAYQVRYESNAVVLEAVAAVVPSILTQPASQFAEPGESVKFSVAATGSPAPAYRWRFNGTPLANATSNLLTLTNVQTSAAGAYSVVVSNSVGVVTSAVATLTVTRRPIVSLITPANLSRFAPGESIPVEITASDPDGSVAAVELFAGGISLGPVAGPPYQFLWSNAPVGVVALQARAVDDLGSAQDSARVYVLVTSNASARLPRLAKQPWSDASFEIDSSARLFAWGNGGNLLGIGATTATNVPTPVWLPPGVAGWSAVACGGYHTLAISVEGQLYNWGSNFRGELGTDFSLSTPRLVANPPGVSGWIDVAAAEHTSIAIADTGEVFTWGQGFFGELGNGTYMDTNRPTRVPFPAGVVGWRAVAAGQSHVLALATDGSLWGWGNNIFGMLGAGFSSSRTNQPQRVLFPSGVTAWRSVAAGQQHSLAIGDNGQVYTWGYNGSGQLGTNFGGTRNAPGPIPRVAGVLSWTSVGAGSTHSLAIADNGTLHAWGDNVDGELNGQPGGSVSAPMAVPFPPGVRGWLAAAGGYNQTLAIGDDCRLHAWGANSGGQLGLGTNGTTPGQVLPLIGDTCAAFVSASPLVTIATPGDGSSVEPGSTNPVVASVFDPDGQVVSVTFYLDGNWLGTSGGPSFAVPWRNAAPGRHVLRAVATDDRGASGVSPEANVLANARPLVNLTAPADGSVFLEGATVPFSATASDSEGPVTRVDFFAGTNLVGTSTAAGNPRTATWLNAVAGVYALTARATDGSGILGTSAPVNVLVNDRPVVSLDGPVDGTVLTEGESVRITGSAADRLPVVAPPRTNLTVELLDGSNLLTRFGLDANTPLFSFVVAQPTVGQHLFSAVATDTLGAKRTSAVVRLVVNSRPYVQITAPTGGALFQEGTDIGITATATNALGAIERVEIFSDGVPLGTSFAPPYRAALSHAAAGVHLLVARATSVFGVAATSAPVLITVNARPSISLSRTNFTYVEDDGVVLLDEGASVSDADSPNFDEGTLTVEFVANGLAEDRLSVRNQGANAGRISLFDGNHIRYDALEIGTFEGGTNGSSPLVIRLGGKATATAVTALVRNLTYENVSSQPSSLSRVVRLLLNDGDGGVSAPVWLTIDVRPVNDPPVFTAGPPVAVDEDSGPQRIVGWATGIGPGAADESGQAVGFIVSNDHPTLFSAQPTLSADGALEFTSAPDAHGMALVTVRLQDDGGTAFGGQDTSLPQIFPITVNPVNDRPAALPQTLSLPEDQPRTITLGGTDIDGDPLTFAIETPPAHGLLTGTGVSRIYTPASNYHGADSFTFRVNDGRTSSAPATVSLTVLSVNDAPVAVIRVQNLVYLTPGATEGFVLSPNNTNALVLFDASMSHDAENDPLDFAWFRDGAAASFAGGVTASNLFAVGSHSVLLVADDGHDAGSATVEVEVITPGMALEEVIVYLNESGLPRNRIRPLAASLKAALSSFERGNFNSAANQLRAFQNKLEAQVAPLDPALAAALDLAVQRILDNISNQ